MPVLSWPITFLMFAVNAVAEISKKNCHGVHGYHGLLRLPITFPYVASRLSRFDLVCLKRGHRDRREHSVNAVLEREEFLIDIKISYIMINWDMKAKVTSDTDEMFIIVSL